MLQVISSGLCPLTEPRIVDNPVAENEERASDIRAPTIFASPFKLRSNNLDDEASPVSSSLSGVSFSHGPKIVIHALRADEASTKQGGRMQRVYDRGIQCPNDTEFPFLQVMTACTALFAHGANDLPNLIVPFRHLLYLAHRCYSR
jgi:hypothetical protein